MRMLISACCALVAWSGASRAGDDAVTVREYSERYTRGVLKQDRTTLEGLLHKEYRGVDLLGCWSCPRANAAEAALHWTKANNRFTSLETTIERVQVVGDTAIETGSVSANCGERKVEHIFREVHYTRVWVKDTAGWRLAHERY